MSTAEATSLEDHEFESAIRKLEPLIRSLANQYKSRHAQFDDLCQEIRVFAWKRWKSFDSSRGESPKAWMQMTMRKSAIDSVRALLGKHGQKVRMCGALLSEATKLEPGLDPIDLSAGRDLSGVEWQEIVGKIGCLEAETQFIVFSCSGLSMAEIGKRFGVSEACVSKTIKRGRERGFPQAKKLIGA